MEFKQWKLAAMCVALHFQKVGAWQRALPVKLEQLKLVAAFAEVHLKVVAWRRALPVKLEQLKLVATFAEVLLKVVAWQRALPVKHKQLKLVAAFAEVHLKASGVTRVMVDVTRVMVGGCVCSAADAGGGRMATSLTGER